MKDVVATGRKNNRFTTDRFIDWLGKINNERQEELFGIEKYIMHVEAKNGLTLVTTFNGSIYSLPFNTNSHNDLVDLIGYKVTLYPKKYESYELEAFFIWNWEKTLGATDVGFLVVNKVLDVRQNPLGGSMIFENGDILGIPFKDYEKPYFRASKRMHGDDTFREGYNIDFASKIDEMKSRFIGKFVVYSTNLKHIDVARISYNTDISTYEETAHYEWAEMDKFKFRNEVGILKNIATWDVYRVPIYLEDGRIFTFSVWDYSKHINGNSDAALIANLKKDLQNLIGRPLDFQIIYGGDKRYTSNSADVVGIKDIESGIIYPRN